MEKIDNDEGSLGQDNITIRYNSTHKHTDTYVMHACAIHTKLLAGYGSMRMLVQHVYAYWFDSSTQTLYYDFGSSPRSPDPLTHVCT